MQLTDAILKKIAPTISAAQRAEWLKWLNYYCPQYEINTDKRASAFFGNVMEECGRLSRLRENMNYSASRLRQVWPKRFPTMAVANKYAHQPKLLANYVYNGRLGNRVGTDDGWNYRGGGALQTTGRSNYTKLKEETGIDFVNHPEYTAVIQYAVEAACIEWQLRGCNELADAWSLTRICERINGGHNGLANRKAFATSVHAWIPDDFNWTAPRSAPKALITTPLPEPEDGEEAENPAWLPDEEAEDGSVTIPETEGRAEGGEGSENGSDANSAQNSGVSGSDSRPPEKNDTPQMVTKERPSLFSRVMTGILGAIATFFASVTTYCGGNEVAQTLVRQGGEKAVASAEKSDVMWAVIILGFTAVGLGFAVVMFWIATRFYEKSANRSNELNQIKLKSAADTAVNTVDFSKPRV